MPDFTSLAKPAQRIWVARAVALAMEFLKKGESYSSPSKVLDAFRDAFDARVSSFCDALWEGREDADQASELLADLETALDHTNQIPVGRDKLDGHATDCVLVIASACDWVLGREDACNNVAEHLINFWDELGTQAALAEAGRKTMREDEIDRTSWVKPEEDWQQDFFDSAERLDEEKLLENAREGNRYFIEVMLAKASQSIVASRNLDDE